MTASRKQKRREEREKKKKESDYVNLYPQRIFNEDTGEYIDLLIGYCHVCKSQEPCVS